MSNVDHHSEYLACAIAALTPKGHKRANELLLQLGQASVTRAPVVRFVNARHAELESRVVATTLVDDPAHDLDEDEFDVVTTGFTTIRDDELLDDVCDWANAVLALLKDERPGF